jgi:hypothetical protein
MTTNQLPGNKTLFQREDGQTLLSAFGLPLVFAIAWMLVSLTATNALAQVSTATITGVVQDAGGAVVPGAHIVVTQTQTNASAQADSNDRGAFSLPALPVGPYSMTVTFAGFSKYERTNIVLTVGQVANFEVALAVGAETETVTVTAGTPLIEHTEPTIQDTIDQQTVVSLPLNGRNPAELVFTAGGVANTGENNGTGQLSTTNLITPSGVTLPGSIAPAVNGVRAGGTYFSLDGAVNVDPLSVIGAPFPDPDATQEFQVVTGTYGARYVSAPGGAINIVTRAGSNQFHGTVFEFIRNGYFNAENAVLAQPDTLKRNQFGGTIGGPILKDRLFFFGSYQGTRIASQTVNKYPVPTAAERSGAFEACAAGTTCTTANSFPVNLTTLPPIFGPNTQNSVNANFFNYQGSGHSLIPLPNAANNEYVIGVPNHTNAEQYVGRLDYQLTPKHRLFARFYSDHTTTPPVDQPTTAPYNILHLAAGFVQNADNAALGETWTATPNLVFETRVSFLNIAAIQSSGSSSSLVNYPALGATNYSIPNPGGIGITVIGSLIPPAVYGTDKYPRTNFTVSEDVILSRGNHELTFGGDLQRIHNGESDVAGQTGVIIYAGVYTNILSGILGLQVQDAPFADFFLGHPVEFIQGDGFFSSNHGYVPGVYAQDKFRVTNRLTATYGLRYDPWVPYKPENNEISCYRSGEQSSVFTGAPKGLVYPGDPNCPSGGVNGKYNLVQPRVGFAYQVNKKGTQAIRAGYGLYSIQVPLSALAGFQAFPYTRQFIIANPFQSISNIWGSNGLTNPFTNGFVGFGYKPASNVAFPTAPPPNAADFASNFRPGYVQQYSMSYQVGLGANDSIELAYVGTKGTHLAQNYDLNEPGPSATATTANEQARRPNAGIAVLSTEAPIGYSNYSGLQISYHHRLTGGFDINSNFTRQKCIDNGSNPGSTGASVAGDIGIDPLHPAFSRGLCDFDQPFNFRNTVVWNAPSFKSSGALMRTALGSWSLSGNFIFDSGQPFSVTTNGSDNSFTGTDLDRADIVPGQPLHAGGRLNYSAFKLNAAGTLGDSPRNGYRSAPNYQIDTALLKNFKLTERFGLLFRAEAFNVINHPNYFAPFNAWDSANATTFDTYQAARDPRQLQFALKFTF